MKTKLISALIFAGAATASQFASALTSADGTITFTGAITAQTCTINGNGSGSNNFTVTLPTVSSSSLASVGQTNGRTAFSIALTGCTPASGTVHTYFQPGTTTNASTGNLIVATGGATNVELQLLNAADVSKPIKAGAADVSQNSMAQTISAAGAATLNYYVQYYATGAATAGAAKSTVDYTIVYQ